MTSRRLARTGLKGAIVAFGLAACSAGPQSGTVARSGMTPALGQLVQQDGKTVHVWIDGSGPDIVLIHGASGNLRDFTYSLAPKLAQNFRVIALDRPGLGYSDALHANGESPKEQARHLAKVLDQFSVRNAVVVGHSFGGAVAMAWALERPDQTAAVVSLAGATMPWPGDLSPWYSFVGSRLGGFSVAPLIATFAPRSSAEKSVAGIFAPDEVPDGYINYVGVDLTLRTKVLRTNARQVLKLRPHLVEMASLYEQLDIPVELLHGTADTTVPLEVHSKPLAELIPGARLTILDGVGHMPHHADEDATLTVIRRAASRAGLRPNH